MKEGLGLDQSEGRSWRGFHHHACLVMLAYGYLALEPIPFKWAQVTASCYLGFAQNRGNQEATTRMPRGQCTLPADEMGRILDRLAGLDQVIRPQDVRQALEAAGRISTRSCVLTDEVIFRVVLAMGLLTDLPIRQVFKHARRLREGEESPARSNLCMARRRLGVAPLRHLFDRVARPLGRPETPGAFYQGLRLMGLDGVVLDVPDSAANAAAFGRPSAG